MIHARKRNFCSIGMPFAEKVVDKNVRSSYNIQALARVLEW